MSDFECTYSIGKTLVLPEVTRRYENSNGLQIKIINNMRRLLGIKKVLGRPEPDNFIVNTGRCFKCAESTVGTAHYKKKKMKNMLRTKWSKCLKFICKQHQVEVQFVCTDCEKWNIFSTLYTYVRFVRKKYYDVIKMATIALFHCLPFS